jgi:hypothetical protein
LPPGPQQIAQPSAGGEARPSPQAKSVDLLGDVKYLARLAANEQDEVARGVYARSAIVMGVATIEAVTNDALAAITRVLVDPVPPERKREPPYVHFKGRSSRRTTSLLRRGAFHRKRQYVLGHIERITGDTIDAATLRDIDDLIGFRNRIVHMSYQHQPDRHQFMLDSAQAALLASSAEACASKYLDFLSQKFSGLKLPIQAGSR